jgi:hypothetical protein
MRRKTDKPAMAPASPKPGLEYDSKGHPIAMKDRLPEDRQKVRRASKSKATNKRAKAAKT